MKSLISKNASRRLLVAATALAVAVTGAAAVYAAGTMGAKKVVLTNQNASASSVGYSFTINPATTGSTIKRVEVQFGTTQGGSTVPTSMTTTGAAVGSITGLTGTWTGSFATNGLLSISNATGSTPSNPVTIPFTGITNSNANGTYYARISTYDATSAGTLIDQDDVAFVIAPSTVTVSATVNETLTFSLGSTTVALGSLSTGSVSTGTGNMTVATNAANGYGVNASGVTLTKGTDTIPFVSDGTAVAAGTAGYGLRVSTCASGATCSSTQDIGSGLTAGITDLIARTSPTTGDTSTITYRASINGGTPAGNYSSTVSYVAVGKF
jgi:hypothetical protein